MAKIAMAFSDKENKQIKEIDDLIRYTIDVFEKEKFPKYISNYKQYLWYVLDRLVELEAWQTNISYPLASSIIDTEFANLFDFNFVMWIQEPAFKQLCTDTFDYNSQWKRALKSQLKECLICWEAFSTVWMLKKEETYDIWFWKFTETIKTKKPTIDYISIFNVFYDITHGIDKSPYIITRVFSTGQGIHDKYSVLFDDKKHSALNIRWYINSILTEKKSNRIRFSSYDYNPIKRINNFSNQILKSFNNWKMINTNVNFYQDEVNKIDENNFFLVTEKKTYEVVEYLCNDELLVFIDWLLLYKGKSILSLWLSPVQWITFNEIPWGSTSNGQIDNLAHLQNILNGIWNWFLDNMKMQLSWMFAVYGNVPWLSADWKLRFKKFQWIKMTADSRIERLDLWLNDFSPLNIGQFIEQMTEKRAWVNWYLTWWQSKVERVSNSIQLIHDQYKSKLTPIIDSVQLMMWRVSKAWMVMYLKYYSIEELQELWLEVKQDKNWKVLINDIELRKIINDEFISFKFNSLRNIEKEKKRWIIKEIFMQLIQMKQMAPEQLDELFKILLDEDFDLNTFAWFDFNKHSKTILGRDKKEWDTIKEPTPEVLKDDYNIEEEPTNNNQWWNWIADLLSGMWI